MKQDHKLRSNGCGRARYALVGPFKGCNPSHAGYNPATYSNEVFLFQKNRLKVEEANTTRVLQISNRSAQEILVAAQLFSGL